MISQDDHEWMIEHGVPYNLVRPVKRPETWDDWIGERICDGVVLAWNVAYCIGLGMLVYAVLRAVSWR